MRRATRLALAAAAVVIGAGACSRAPAPDDVSPPAPGRPPNILLIVADDLGFTDLGAYGSEIRTPVLDGLARSGLVFSQFRTSPTCSPTRASLMSGTDPHVSGLGNMFEELAPNQKGQPGYEGHLNFDVAPLPAVLKQAGYRTYMAGKWHLGRDETTSPKARGFDRSFALIPGGSSHFKERRVMEGEGEAPFREDGALVDRLPDDFYSTRSFTDTLIGYLGERGPDDAAPFFAYLAFSAPHFPLQAPDESIAAYRGMYDEGYEALFEARLAAVKRLGLAPSNATGDPLYHGSRPWAALTPDERKVEARRMEIFAAMVTEVDTAVGRVLDVLRGRGELERTIVVFMSDNGAEGHRLETEWTAAAETAQACCDNALENMGRPSSYVWLGPDWARASSAPFHYFKGYPTEGGIRAPFIVSYPALATRGHTDARAHVTDVMPTLLDLAGVPRPGPEFQGHTVAPMTGVSLRALLEGRAAGVRDPQEVTAGELMGKRFVTEGPLKAVWMPPPHGIGDWQLFDLSSDPSEQHDLGGSRAADLARLAARWDDYAKRHRVILPDWLSGY
ncbi:MAG: arylsulfatase [Vicinamibacterales bacterium]